MKNLIVSEAFESIEIGNDNINKLTEREAEELNTYIEANKLDEENIIWGRHSIKFINYVGYIQLSTCSIEILPKVRKNTPEESRRVLLNMLSKSGYFNIKYSDISSLKLEKNSLFEIFGYLFAIKLKNEILKGKVSNYISIEENLQILKGKLMINHHMKNIVHKNSMVYCLYEEFSSNSLLNQIFKLALYKLIPNIKNIETLKILKFCFLNFVEVEDKQVSKTDIGSLLFDRTNRRFYESYILARMFLTNTISQTTVGSSKNFSILFKMEELFEKYIAYIVGRNSDYDVITQHKKYRLLINENKDKGVFYLKPDIVVMKENKETLLIDTKWKLISGSYNRHGVKREDLFQMYAYLTRYNNAKSVILLYPHNEELEEKKEKYFKSWCLQEARDKKIRVYSVNYEVEELAIEEINNIISTNI